MSAVPDNEKKQFETSFDIIHDYSEYSTIQGLIYIFFAYQTLFGKIFWSLVILRMIFIYSYFSNVLMFSA